jgi:hypothetical protein
VRTSLYPTRTPPSEHSEARPSRWAFVFVGPVGGLYASLPASQRFLTCLIWELCAGFCHHARWRSCMTPQRRIGIRTVQRGRLCETIQSEFARTEPDQLVWDQRVDQQACGDSDAKLAPRSFGSKRALNFVLNIVMKQSKLDPDLSHQAITSVLLDIFCKGIARATSKNIRTLALVAIALGPLMGAAVIVFGKTFAIIVTFVMWNIFSTELLAIFKSRELFFTAAVMLIFWQSLMEGLVRVSIDLVVLISNGHALKWICNNYLEGSAIAMTFLKSPAFAPVISHYCDAIPIADRSKYAVFLDLANQASNPMKANEVQDRIDGYFREANATDSG